jgi:hypothetical protein
MIDAIEFEDRETTFNGVGVRVAADVLIGRMIDCAMAGKAFADLPLYTALVSAKV